MNISLGHNVATYNLACVAAIAALGAVALWDNVAPKPNLRITQQKIAKQRQELRTKSAMVKADLTRSTQAVDQRMWTKGMDTASPTILSEVNKLAVANNVRIVSFRPQKPADNGGLLQLGFALVCEGGYTQVVGLIRGMEKSMPRVVVHQVQLASTDGASDKTSATIGLAAFVPAPKETETKSGNGRMAMNGR